MSGTSEIKVTFGALSAAQGDVASTAARITAQLEDLKRSLAPMVATWHGQAAADYGLRQRQWDAAAADINRVLQQIGAGLGTANESYQQAELINKRRWS